MVPLSAPSILYGSSPLYPSERVLKRVSGSSLGARVSVSTSASAPIGTRARMRPSTTRSYRTCSQRRPKRSTSPSAASSASRTLLDLVVFGVTQPRAHPPKRRAAVVRVVAQLAEQSVEGRGIVGFVSRRVGVKRAEDLVVLQRQQVPPLRSGIRVLIHLLVVEERTAALVCVQLLCERKLGRTTLHPPCADLDSVGETEPQIVGGRIGPLADLGFLNEPLAFRATRPGHELWYLQPQVDRLQRVFQRTKDALCPPCTCNLLRSSAQILAQADIALLILRIVRSVLERLGSFPLRRVVHHQAVVRTHPPWLAVGEVEVPGEPRQRLA
eukprot:3211614-Prymnesium_polylepis.1